ncbi:conserved hypothetical protein [Xenorhabdus nematophila F1]|nr:hypothetical protein D3790_04470 [Xenorhabdus nematophila]CCW29679.1 conserved hypothetical protein [Xenorhabdus nematophila F1]
MTYLGCRMIHKSPLLYQVILFTQPDNTEAIFYRSHFDFQPTVLSLYKVCTGIILKVRRFR